MMTPQEAANCTFAKSMVGGYNMASVDDFLDKLTEDYAALYKENAALKAKLKVLADKTEEYREIEDAMRSTLLTAQRMATSIVSEAEAKREALIADGTGEAKQRLAELQAEVIRELADEGPCVIVGRCSDYVLGERPECLKVFVHADLPSRVERCVEEYHIPSDDMARRIVQMDKGRANYYNYYTGHTWGDMRRYDLTLNSGVTGVEGAVELIVALVRARSALEVE